MIGIVGPDYELVENDATFEIEFINLPMGVSPADMHIEWYKNDVLVPQLPAEDDFSLILYDIDYPAEGTYSARVVYVQDGETKYSISNQIVFEVGVVPRNIVLNVVIPSSISLKLGDTEIVSPRITSIPQNCKTTYTWKDLISIISTDNSMTFEGLEEKYGEYKFEVTGTALGAYIPITRSFTLRVVKTETDECTCCRYIHDLPHRGTGFIWVGYWVIDEILKARDEGFDWLNDPQNDRFRWKCEIETLANGFKKWNDLEIQESRNGYILNLVDLI